MKRWQTAIFGLGMLGCTVGAEPIRVLLIGNSYTQQIRKPLEEVFGSEVKFTLVTPGGCTLERHAKPNSKALEALRDQGPWQVVVLQEQSQVPAFVAVESGWWERFFDKGVAPLAKQARAAGADVVLYQTWARRAGETKTLSSFDGKPGKMQDALTSSYARAAKEVGPSVRIAPVGEAFRAALASDAPLALHANDGSHPGTNGRYVAALVLYEAILQRSSIGQPISGVAAVDRSRVRAAVAATKNLP